MENTFQTLTTLSPFISVSSLRVTRLIISLRVEIVILIIVGSILLQHFFKPARIVLGVISSTFLGLIAYGAFQGNTSFSPFIPMGIAIGIAATLNVISWFRMDIGNKESDNPA